MNYFQNDFGQPYQLFQVSYQTPKIKQTDDLKLAIQMLIGDLEQSINKTQAITLLTQKYNIKRRRLYDVINVFSSIGCCNKSGLDHLVWYGKNMLGAKLEQLKEKFQVHNKEMTLQELFPISGCIGISNLTVCFLLLFFALKTNRLDLRFVGNLFSRQTSRYKTTLCKLYQISYILGSIGITNRTNQVCEVVLNDPYYNENIVPDEEDDKTENVNPFSISSLLNKPEKPNQIEKYISDRRKEFKDLFIQSISSKSIIMP
ncbi:hypothetical protein TRFO_19119 [Tritrichomonas foetus]|uniref:E2F/DP family winged-helix DNA-binding domain-containing protein n=1 Tax=Tritrichomonas foetus TaxID=1144522 RepID=A0A1J4KKL0_9EUKA|nr:hypothetical protein TRFO_19119 [Tritrichomonas foetus]|eukprot:OHT11472.1 hypothetical protein TRFO_19119 [Tritrichomonas foetus]